MNFKMKIIHKELINSVMDSGYLVSPDVIEGEDFNDGFLVVLKNVKSIKDKPVVISKDVFKGLSKDKIRSFDWVEFDKSKVLYEKGMNLKPYNVFKHMLSGEEVAQEKSVSEMFVKKVSLPQSCENSVVKIIKNYGKGSKKWSVKDFMLYFKKRYGFLKNVLQGRPELENMISLNRVKNKESKSKVSCIGLIYDKRVTKNGNTIVTFEDPTGFVNMVLKPNLKGVEDLCLDEVVGITGRVNKGMIFVEELVYPNMPINTNLKKAKDEVYAVVISDIQLGSDRFLEEPFLKFIDWLNLKNVDEKERSIAEKVKYVFIAGDLVAGVGVYPQQEKDLVIIDLKEQYDKIASYLSTIRDDIKLIICPGNHDATRLADPQPPPIPEFVSSLLNLKNAYLVSSPAVVNIHSSKDFEGFNFLLYHGASFHFYANSVPHLRLADAKNNPAMIWKYLLNKRHLAPTHGSTVYIPNSEDDALLIDKIPDVVINGDMHTSDAGLHNGVVIISGSCWEEKGEVQIRRGNEPDPGRVPFFNLKTREVSFLDFYKK